MSSPRQIIFPFPDSWDPFCSSVKFSEPYEVGCFIKKSNTYTFGGEPVVYRPPPLGVDLSSIGVSYDGSGADLGHIQETLTRVGFDLLANRISFVTYRNNLNKIMSTPYSKNLWRMGVYKHKNVIYLQVDSSRLEGDPSDTSFFDRIGRGFETVSTITPEGGSSQSVDSIPTEYCVVEKLHLNGIRLILGAEIDCVQDGFPVHEKSKHYVELKTSKVLLSDYQALNFRKYKLLKYWIQSFLAGVRTIVVGFHRDGILEHIHEFNTLAIPRECKNEWNANICLNFTSSVLSFLQKEVQENVYYTLSYDPIESKNAGLANHLRLLVNSDSSPKWFRDSSKQ